MDDKEAFPNYPYRDDALLIHEAIYTYVREVLEAFYGEQILFCGYNFSFLRCQVLCWSNFRLGINVIWGIALVLPNCVL